MAFIVKHVIPEDYQKLGELMVEVSLQLDGFPKPEEQPDYYNLLRKVGDFTKNETTELLGIYNDNNNLLAGVVFFGDMKYYG